MKLVIVTNDSFYPRVIASYIIKTFKNDIQAIFFSNSAGNESLVKMARKIVKTSGVMFPFYNFVEVFAGSLRTPSIKKEAGKWAIDCYMTDNINDDVELLKAIAPDIIISIGFLQILKKAVIDIPQQGCINLHGALLPRYRGRVVYFWMLLNEEKKTGSTVHFIDEGIDTGDILLQEEVDIQPEDTMHAVALKTVDIGKKLLVKAIQTIQNGQYRTTKQDHSQSLYTSFPSREEVRLFQRKGKKFFTIKELMGR